MNSVVRPQALPSSGPADAPTPAVALSSVTRLFGMAPALVRVDLRVEPGETLLVRGPNGAGKSTLLRVIATALSPTFGSGTVLGHDLLSEREEIRRRTELMGHRTRLYEDLSGLENLRVACSLYGCDPRAVPQALERVGLTDVAGERVRTYSQGMRQRVAVARAILRSPDLLLLDEPYTGLDAEAREIVDGLIGDLGRAGRTVLLATHHPVRPGLTDRTVFMEAGRLLAQAPAEAGTREGGGVS